MASSEQVETVARGMRSPEENPIYEAALALGHMRSREEAYDLLESAIKLNQKTGHPNVDRIKLAEDGDIIISNPFTHVTARVDFAAPQTDKPGKEAVTTVVLSVPFEGGILDENLGTYRKTEIYQNGKPPKETGLAERLQGSSVEEAAVHSGCKTTKC